jgi:O-acetyl-ADP-ribose deacetylase
VIDVTIDDLAFVDTDAIARPVNAELRATTPVMRRLEHAAGDAMVAQLRVNEPLDVGAAVVTAAGGLVAPFLIHAVVSTATEPVSRDGVRRATVSALQRARDWEIGRLAMAPFGLGAGNLDADEAAQAMLPAIADHLQRAARPAEVRIVVETELEAGAFRAAIQRLGAQA